MFTNDGTHSALPEGLVVTNPEAQNEITIRSAHMGRSQGDGEGVTLRGATIMHNRDNGGTTIQVRNPLWRDEEEDSCTVAKFDIVGFTFNSAPYDGVMYFSGWLVGGAWYPAGTTAEDTHVAHGRKADDKYHQVRKHDGTDPYCKWEGPHYSGVPYLPPAKRLEAHEVEICVRPISEYGYRLVVNGKKKPIVKGFDSEEAAQAGLNEVSVTGVADSGVVYRKYGNRGWEEA
jgi:hypothetical protein